MSGDPLSPDWSEHYAADDVEASRRYRLYKEKDPLPDIQPSLLNSADMAKYVAATGLIVPFDSTKRKSASYGVALKGRVVYWNAKGEKQEFVFADTNKDKENYPDCLIKEKFILEKNSIAFVTLEPYFRVPNYIAIRYDFTIREIYRGLLLGTGPLVDPGFEGYLSIPIHNLTNNDYLFQFNPKDEVIWFEFTKMTILGEWVSTDPRTGKFNPEFAPFPPRKNERKNVEHYIQHALEGQNTDRVESSIPPAIREHRAMAERAESYAKSLRNITAGVAIFTLFFGFYGIASVLYQSWDVSRDALDQAMETKDEIKALQDELIKTRAELDSARNDAAKMIQRLSEKADNRAIVELMSRIEGLEKELKSVTEGLAPNENK